MPPHRRLSGFVFVMLFAAALGVDAACGADTGPQPPCGGAPFPPYPEADAPPAVRVWGPDELGRDWAAPACTGWTAPGFTTLVATAARFRAPRGIDGLVRRVGAISGRTGIRYWSVSRKGWSTLITDARALQGPSGDRPREDFTPDELAEGRNLYFRQVDNLLGDVTYRMRIRTRSSDRLVFETENTSTVRNLLVPVFRPGEIQSLHFLERESRDVWRYYGLMRTGRNASRLTAGHEESYANRAVAFYRYLAGIPTDKEPPRNGS